MADTVKRSKTKYKSIYFNENTKKYDVKYNFKEYDPKTEKNRYRAKWVYNINTLTEARQELAKLQAGGIVEDSKDITLKGVYELWLIKAKSQDFSPVTINNTSRNMAMIYQFLPSETKLKNIDETVYQKFCADMREHNYSEETLRLLNSTFRKMINLAYKKKLIKENFLDYADNMKTKRKEDYTVITKEEFDLLDNYFKNNEYWRLGENKYPKFRLMFNILYYCGLRIGECLALTYNDFEEFSYYRKTEEKPIRIAPTSEATEKAHLQGMRININKAYVSAIKLTKDPKNLKKRSIPLAPAPERLFMRIKEEHLLKDGSMEDKIFNWQYGLCDKTIKKACKDLELPLFSCHMFRHTFISNLIKSNVPLSVIEKVSGDTQEIILKRYSHMFENDEIIVLEAMKNL
ncbi:tyrosine-type recombinase/integrase [Thomasclavelia cocleata]|uniref:tyrosine-type recombinase/integrase n=1 Tax=Thomasclavelia cocleata TaxID=69824 RepID=UPI00255B067A|nr:site-specific integrase [Thomasclavelia cocleata]